MSNLLSVIETVSGTLKSALDTLKTNKEQQTVTFTIKEVKKLQKAADITEEILKIVQPYTVLFSRADERKYQKLINKFLKKN